MTIRDRQVLSPEPSPRPLQARAPLPIVSGAVIAISAMRFLLDLRLLQQDGDLPWALYGPKIEQGEWWRLILSALEHGAPGLPLTISVMHIGFNMSVVWTLGIPLERLL